MKKPILLSALLAATVFGGTPALAQATPGAAANAPEQSEWLQTHTISMFTDVLRADVIATGTIVEVENPGWPRLVFEPDEYLKGSPLPMQRVTLITNTNAQITYLEGQRVVAGIVHRADNDTYGLAHGVQSLTPEHLGVETSIQFYRDLLAAAAPYDIEIAEALEANPKDGMFAYPEVLVDAWLEIFVEYFGETGTQAAHHASRELWGNPVFQDRLTEDHLASIASNLVESDPGTYDRGYGYMLLNREGSNALALADCINLMRDETAYVNLDHMAIYLQNAFERDAVVEAVSEVMTSQLYTESERHNAMQLASRHGGKGFLSAMHELIGHENTLANKRALLECFRNIPDPSNLPVLINYLNGGDAEGSEVKVQDDCSTSRGFFKRTMLAIAMINTDIDDELFNYDPETETLEEHEAERNMAVHNSSNAFLRVAYGQARYQWVRDYLKYLQPENEDWRKVIQIFAFEDTMPVEPVGNESAAEITDNDAGESEGGNDGNVLPPAFGGGSDSNGPNTDADADADAEAGADAGSGDAASDIEE